MIEKKQIDRISKEHLKTALHAQPHIYKKLVTIPEYKIWLSLCEDRVKQMFESKFIRGPRGMKDFIEKAATAYALKRLEEWELRIGK